MGRPAHWLLVDHCWNDGKDPAAKDMSTHVARAFPRLRKVRVLDF